MELHKSLLTENNESHNISGYDVGKLGRRNDDDNVDKSIHRKQMYSQILGGDKIRYEKLNSPNVISDDK